MPQGNAMRDLRDVLLRCGPFESHSELRAVFVDERLRPWHERVPEAESAAARVDAIIELLHDQRTAEGEPALAVLCRVLAERLHPGDECHDALQQAANTLAPPPEATAGPAPYRGLQYYDVEDADLFFGREALVERLHGRAVRLATEGDGRYLAIVGASGSGKSSLLRAGLLPSLAQEGPFASEGEQPAGLHLMTPTAQPLRALATTLTRDAESVRETATLIDDLRNDARSLDLYAERLLAESEAEYLLLVVDQFEEIFTQCQSEAERKAFVDNVTTAVAPGTAGRTVLLLALRADFYHRCAEYETLRTLLAKHQVYIGPMDEDGLQRAIEGPARHLGLTFESGLVARMLEDAGGQPGVLPLLSHALDETWKRRDGKQLTHMAYTAVGGVRGALATTAERTFRDLDAAQQTLARRLLIRMVSLGGAGTPDTRDRATRDELRQVGEDAEAVEALLDRLVNARLLTVHEDGVEVAHEALIHHWPRLQRWLEENRERLQHHQRLTAAAEAWVELDHDAGALYRGVRLARARALAADPEIPLSELEEHFLAESERALRMKAARRRAARQRVRVSALAGLLGGALAFGLTSWIAYQPLIGSGSLLAIQTVLRTLLGGISGLLLVVLSDMALAVPDGCRRWAQGAFGGALALGVLMVGNGLMVSSQPLTWILSGVAGAVWGALAGAGRVWTEAQERPAWQALLLLTVAGALLLMPLDRLFGLFQWRGAVAYLPAVALIGGLTPLGQLVAARLVGVGEEERAVVYGDGAAEQKGSDVIALPSS